MRTSSNRAEITAGFQEFVSGMALYGGHLREYDNEFVIQFSQGVFGDEATVQCGLGRNLRYNVTVSWSGSIRNLAGAIVAVENYRAALRVAAILQAFADRLPDVS